MYDARMLDLKTAENFHSKTSAKLTSYQGLFKAAIDSMKLKHTRVCLNGEVSRLS